MGTASEDRSEFLKEALADSFFDLMKEKPIAKITVDDIVNHAGVGRMTYYRDFNNKVEIIIYKLARLHQIYLNSLPQRPENSTARTEHLLKWIYQDRDYFAVIHKQNPFLIFLFFAHDATPDQGNSNEDIYKTSFYIFGFVGIVLKWCERDFVDKPEEVMEYLKQWQVLNS